MLRGVTYLKLDTSEQKWFHNQPNTRVNIDLEELVAENNRQLCESNAYDTD